MLEDRGRDDKIGGQQHLSGWCFPLSPLRIRSLLPWSHCIDAASTWLCLRSCALTVKARAGKAKLRQENPNTHFCSCLQLGFQSTASALTECDSFSLPFSLPRRATFEPPTAGAALELRDHRSVASVRTLRSSPTCLCCHDCCPGDAWESEISFLLKCSASGLRVVLRL